VTRRLGVLPLVGVIALVVAGCATPSEAKVEGTTVHLTASGDVKLETGAYYGGNFQSGTGDITIDATDTGDRVTLLPPHDQLSIKAALNGPAGAITVEANDPMVEDPMGRWTTWWGVGLDVDHHGNSGIGTNLLPNIHSSIAAFGMGKVSVAGQVIADGVMVHIMTADNGLPGRLELDVGDPASPVPGLADGHIRAVWADYKGEVPDSLKTSRYLGGGIVLLVLVIGMLWLNVRERFVTP
jgi:hypothetical protein